MTAILKMQPQTGARPSWPQQRFRLQLNNAAERREVVPFDDSASNSDSTSDVNGTDKNRGSRRGSGDPPSGGSYQRPDLPSPSKTSGQTTLWACGVGALASTGLALVTHFSDREIFGPAHEILKPVFTFMAILLATIFGAGWLTEPNLQSIDSTSIAHSSGSIG